jgi:putative holliday junction resolvase
MTILALDHGTKRIGIAISDQTLMLARPLPFLEPLPFQNFVDQLKELIRSEQVSLILVGMPRNMDGSYGPASEKVKEFIFHLKEAIQIPIQTVDERLSTVQASRQLREKGQNSKTQKKFIDSQSAVVLLQSYLDNRIT